MTLVEEYLEAGAYLPKTLDEIIADLEAQGYFEAMEDFDPSDPTLVADDDFPW